MSGRRRTERRSLTDRLAHRLAATRVGAHLRSLRDAAAARTVTHHWTSYLGSPIVVCTALLVLTGIPLMFWYVPSSELVRYEGTYAPLAGVEMSRAYESVLQISLETRGGLLVRQVHHWAGLLLPALLAVQLAATWFTGRSRRPRRLAWLLLCGTMGAALLGGWSGYGMPDDLLSGSGLRIFQGIMLSIPFVGTGLTALVFGDGFPGRVIEFLYPLHAFLAPTLLVGFLVARAIVAWRLPGARRRSSGRAGRRLREIPLTRAFPTALGAATVSAMVLVLIGATVTVAPVWLSGPADPGSATAASQPDWYTGFLDGSLRLVPPGWEIEIGGATVTLALLVPLAVVGVFVASIVVVPVLEDRVRRDRGFHTVLGRPRDMPVRTGLGVAVLAFYGVLWSAASADVVAQQFRLGLEQVIHAHQIALIIGPVIGFVVARRVCRDLRARDLELLDHGVETGRIVRLPGGEYVEVHATLDDDSRATLAESLGVDTAHEAATPVLSDPLEIMSETPAPIPARRSG